MELTLLSFLEKDKAIRNEIKARISEIKLALSQFSKFLEDDSVFVEEAEYIAWKDKYGIFHKLLKKPNTIIGFVFKLLSNFKKHQTLKQVFFTQEEEALIKDFLRTYENSKYYIQQHNRKYELREEILSSRTKIESANCEFERYLKDTCSYFNHLKYTKWKSKNSGIYKLLDVPETEMPKALYAAIINLICNFRAFYKNGQEHIEKHNIDYISNELENNKDLFDSLEKYPLNQKQKESIVCNEDNVLVIAGAGTGKTSCIVGKVAYLIKRHGVKPEEILLLAFNNDAVDDMIRRVKKAGERTCQLLDTVVIRTFHKFGLEVIAEATGEKPSLAFKNDTQDGQLDCLNDIFKEILKDEKYKTLIIDYLSCYLHPHKKQNSFAAKGDYYRYLKAQRCLTFKNEPLKSQEEVAIANFLFLHSIEYEYEWDYEFKTTTQFHSQYKPDFYLPVHKIYIEHFAIDRVGNVPEWFSSRNDLSPKQCYNEGIKWKRECHQKHNTKLIETYSYERSEGNFLNNLKKKLVENNVELKPKTREEILACLKRKKKSIPQLIHLFQTFLNLKKSNCIEIDAIKSKINNLGDKPRLDAFIQIFNPIYNQYENYLRDIGKIDFSDMIVQATQYIKSTKYKSPFKYILVDEFQDMSVGRYYFIKALLDQNKDQRFYAVGDDWQSIYRFTGSDISIITGFECHFGYTKIIRVGTTYRFNQEITDFTGKFIQKNPKQLKKDLRSDISTESISEYPPYEIHYGDNALKEILNRIQEDSIGDTGSDKIKVFIIGRYNFNVPANMKGIQSSFNRLDIEFTTAHKAKGRQADFVVIVGMTCGKYGFPTEIIDDPITNLVLEAQDDFPNAEERRLFYVTLTRTKRVNFLITDNSKRSAFIDELDNTRQQIRRCPWCETGLLVERKGQYGMFCGCSNFPYCKYKESNDNSITINPKRTRYDRKNTKQLADKNYLSTFRHNDRVRHHKFGFGCVKEFHNQGENSTVLVKFISGEKLLMIKYDKLENV